MNAESINMFAIVFVYPAKKMKDLPFKKRCAVNELTYKLLILLTQILSLRSLHSG